MIVEVPTRSNQLLFEPQIADLLLSQLAPESDLTLSEDGVQAGQSLQQGNQLFKAEQYEAALAAYEQALELVPNFPAVWLNTGTTYLMLNLPKEALTAYDRALALRPDLPYGWCLKSVALEKQGLYGDALAAIDEAIQQQSDVSKFWSIKGLLLLNLERYDNSILASRQAINIQRDDYDSWLNMGVALTKLERYEEAVKAYGSAIEIQPDRSDAWYDSGLSLLELHRYEAAIAAYSQAIVLEPNFSAAWYNRACAYGLQGNATQAVQDLRQAIQLDSRWRETAQKESSFTLIAADRTFQELLENSTLTSLTQDIDVQQDILLEERAWQAYLDSEREREEVYRRLANS